MCIPGFSEVRSSNCSFIMEAVAVLALADSTTTIDNNNLEGTNKSLNMTDNSHGGDDEAAGGELPNFAEKLIEMQNEVDKLTGPLNMSTEEKIEADNRSVYVGNVDYGATAEELKQHFHEFGFIKRVTILCNKFDGHPKGFAFIEYGDKDSAQTAMAMDGSFFRSRQIKVMPKRTNMPGLSTTNRPPRGMPGRGRSFRGGISP